MPLTNKIVRINAQEKASKQSKKLATAGKSSLNIIDMQFKAAALQKAIFNSANFLSIATDTRGVIQIFNVGAQQMLGYSVADVVNTLTLTDITAPQEAIARTKLLSIELNTPIASDFEAMVFKASRGIEDIYEHTYIRKDGSCFPAVVSITALRNTNNKIIGYLLIAANDTERESKKSKLLLGDAALKAIAEGVVVTDADGFTIYANEAFLKITGYAQEELIGKNLSLLQGRLTDIREIEKIRRTLIIGSNYTGDILNYKKDGHSLPEY
jgi:PAS domain S-box-containing protein